jgi:hypothetical protein
MFMLVIVYYLAHGLVTQSAIHAPTESDCNAAGFDIAHKAQTVMVAGREWPVEKVEFKCVNFPT